MTASFRSLATATAAAALLATGLAGAASAAQVNYPFTATVVNDPSGLYLGQTGSGTFTFDTDDIIAAGADTGDINLIADPSALPFSPFPIPGYDFTFTFGGQFFTDPDSPLSILSTRNFVPIQWAFGVEAENIDDPFLRSITTVPVDTNGVNLIENEETGVLEVGLSVEVVPLPPSLWMLGAGVLGLGAWARRRKPAA